jgi:hypothetical protein
MFLPTEAWCEHNVHHNHYHYIPGSAVTGKKIAAMSYFGAFEQSRYSVFRVTVSTVMPVISI